MKSIKGTFTEQNLLKAFAGESQARNRYTYFASVAKKEGYEQIAAIFLETAEQEKEHAKRFFKLLEGGQATIYEATYPAGKIGTTPENLLAAAQGVDVGVFVGFLGFLGAGEAALQCLEDHIVTDDSFVYLIPSCTAIENALTSYLEEVDLHRDYVHMTDLGRVISSYTWYCRLAGVEQLDEVKLDAIPMAFLKSTSDKTQDRVLTEAEKAIILESVNNALQNPLQMTQSQYTVAP